MNTKGDNSRSEFDVMNTKGDNSRSEFAASAARLLRAQLGLLRAQRGLLRAQRGLPADGPKALVYIYISIYINTNHIKAGSLHQDVNTCI
jgi:hypothetical protein